MTKENAAMRRINVPDELVAAADLFRQRQHVYGKNYKDFGPVAQAMLANIKLESAEDFARLGVLVQIISKLTRYCVNFNKGGHDDSLMDLSVYAQMLRELDQDKRIGPTGLE